MNTAFVLTGGGSLGAIQVGMLQAVAEHGIEPDVLVGTSVGALNAAWVATHGTAAADLITRARNTSTEWIDSGNLDLRDPPRLQAPSSGTSVERVPSLSPERTNPRLANADRSDQERRGWQVVVDHVAVRPSSRLR